MIICRQCEELIDDFVIINDGIDEWYYCPECAETLEDKKGE